ncbi:MAG: TSUP family transporter [Alicyclobacillaceae bacterium]|nr:TSUP family transporter [Alicyclobacillaceae bacterium]
MHTFWVTDSILLLFGFVAAFIDSSVGGGGLISLPTLLLLGLPPTIALGTNKLGGTMSAVTSFTNYARTGHVHFRLIRWLVPFGFVGAILGATVVRHISPDFLRPIVVIMLVVVAAYSIVRRRLGTVNTYIEGRKATFMGACVASALLGFYDGFFGPGTGSFLILSFLLLGFDYIQASGNAKSVNLASNIGALLTFVIAGDVAYADGFILGAGMMIGAFTGSQVAIRHGVKYIRPIFICITFAMISQQLYQLFISH